MPFDPAHPFPSRLPDVGTTIFTVMSALAQQCDAVNLGQGFPDFDGDPALQEAVTDAMRRGLNQYPPMAGVPELREAVAAKVERLYGRRYDPGHEVTVTAGATQALLTAVLACVQPGDEAIVFEPCYDSYVPAITMAGGTVRRVALTPGTFEPDFDAIAAALGPRTRAIFVNSPHNPTGTVWSRAHWQRLATLLAPWPTVVVSDEVYEHMVYDGAPHVSASSVPGIAERAFVVSSFGKTFHVTGWKVGTVVAPAALTAEFRKVHQFNVFTVNTPMQHAIAAYLADPAPYENLPAFYQRKRDHFRAGLRATRFELLPCAGTYFQCVRYGDVPSLATLDDVQACERLTREHGVAAIPLSAFGGDAGPQPVIRLCFAKREATLDAALERLARV